MEYVGVALTKIKMRNVSVYELEVLRAIRRGQWEKPVLMLSRERAEGLLHRIDGSYSNVVGLPLEFIGIKSLNDFVNNDIPRNFSWLLKR
ncbi:hypothetical protein [Candidatus Kuenenia stuttgartiensis]|uniref:hypothetical protein n=1 Tax=Kuenenia stuttgartiensis TaxID=174633 RepID=UPI00146BE2F0|nr:hypothetical protein [Candidatus Kuenenia stuttgartiensis]